MEKYWFEDLNILLDTNRLDEFYPTNCMNYKTKVNSLVRGSIYIGIILSVLKKNYLLLYIPLITMLMTLVLYYLREINKDTDKRIQKLNEETNNNLPIIKYSDLDTTKIDYNKCTICLANFDNEDLVKMLPCQHIFHNDCINVWLQNYNYKCPICRKEAGKGKPNL